MGLEEQGLEALGNVAAGGVPSVVAAAAVAAGVTLAVLLVLGLYIYFSMAWMSIARKKSCRYAWLAWIPVVNIGLMLHLGGFHWGWTFLVLIPILGWIAVFVLLIIATWRVFVSLHYPGWFSLSLIIPQIGGILYLIAIGFAAWHEPVGAMKHQPRKKTTRKKKSRR